MQAEILEVCYTGFWAICVYMRVFVCFAIATFYSQAESLDHFCIRYLQLARKRVVKTHHAP
jgi:hypothetical protein